ASGDGAVLAEARWEAGQPGTGVGASGTAGDEPASGDFLVRVSGTYVIYQTDGADWEWDALDAADDATAIARFRDHQGEGTADGRLRHAAGQVGDAGGSEQVPGRRHRKALAQPLLVGVDARRQPAFGGAHALGDDHVPARHPEGVPAAARDHLGHVGELAPAGM